VRASLADCGEATGGSSSIDPLNTLMDYELDQQTTASACQSSSLGVLRDCLTALRDFKKLALFCARLPANIGNGFRGPVGAGYRFISAEPSLMRRQFSMGMGSGR